jgi:hypothetical protein
MAKLLTFLAQAPQQLTVDVVDVCDAPSSATTGRPEWTRRSRRRGCAEMRGEAPGRSAHLPSQVNRLGCDAAHGRGLGRRYRAGRRGHRRRSGGRWRHGRRTDRPRTDGLRIDGLRIDGLRIDGLRIDGLRSDGRRSDGRRCSGEKPRGRPGGGLVGRAACPRLGGELRTGAVERPPRTGWDVRWGRLPPGLRRRRGDDSRSPAQLNHRSIGSRQRRQSRLGGSIERIRRCHGRFSGAGRSSRSRRGRRRRTREGRPGLAAYSPSQAMSP